MHASTNVSSGAQVENTISRGHALHLGLCMKCPHDIFSILNYSIFRSFIYNYSIIEIEVRDILSTVRSIPRSVIHFLIFWFFGFTHSYALCGAVMTFVT